MNLAADLSDRAFLKLSGADRTRYLQGQVTNDLALLAGTGVLEACLCNAKGGLEAHVFIRERTETTRTGAGEKTETFYLLDADAPLRETLHARLEKYLIADDCEVADVTDNYALYHLISHGEDPGDAWELTYRFGPSGFDHVYSTLHDTVATDHPLASPGDLERLRIAHGIPRWNAELTPGLLLPELGDAFLSRNVSYTKGCYVGQEVVSRVKSAGKVNRLLVALVAADPGAPLAPGLDLYTESAEKPVGSLTSCSTNPAVALGFVKRAHAAPGTRLLAGNAALPLEISKTPLILRESES